MTRTVNNILVIEEEPPQQCDLCRKIAELRPYGPNGEKVCFDCGMKNPAAAEARFIERLRVKHGD